MSNKVSRKYFKWGNYMRECVVLLHHFGFIEERTEGNDVDTDQSIDCCISGGLDGQKK